MIRSRSARTVANLAIASALAIFLGGVRQHEPAVIVVIAAGAGARRRRPKCRRPSAPTRSSAAGVSPPSRIPTTAPAPKPRREAQCKQPYVIGAGTTGGVIMHLADQATPQELRLKGSPSGKNYIGPAGPAGGEQDREIVSFDGRVLITRFIDKDAATRYGNMVYVRCAPRA